VKEVKLKLEGIDKSFGGIHALKSVDFTLCTGEIHALLGENGAGKSTLVKILTGVHQADSGKVFLDDEQLVIESPIDARRKGIGVIYQELSLINSLSVGENIFLGNEPSIFLGAYDRQTMYKKSEEFLQKFEIDINPRKIVSELRMGQKRIVEIVKALALDAKILLLDEPTTGMSQKEIDSLFQIMDSLRNKKVTMIYISHYLDEVFRICDMATVLRDGEVVDTFEIATTNSQELVKAMIGRDIKKTEAMEVKDFSNKETILELTNFQTNLMRKPVSLSIKQGEILGITGIVGAGKSELAHSVFGIGKKHSGTITLHGKEIAINSTMDARKQRLALIPEDRKSEGLFLKNSVAENLMMVNIDASIGRMGMLDKKKSADISRKIGESLQLTPLIPEMLVGNLSGGNQQKVVIGKWLSTDPEVIMMDEPTRGIDVGAKGEIYTQIRALAEQDKGVIVFSSEYQELIDLCDRILILHLGSIVGNFASQEVTGKKILSLSLGGEL